jgi:hypothetical protein
MLKINGHESLSKDPNTGAILNTDDAGYQSARIWRSNAIKNRNTEMELDQIKGEISEIKTLLLELLKSNASTNS